MENIIMNTKAMMGGKERVDCIEVQMLMLWGWRVGCEEKKEWD